MNAEPLLHFVNIADSIVDVAELTREARDAAASFGVTAVSANLILSPDRPGGPDMLIGDDRWREWRPRYLREAMRLDDPALHITRISRAPFTWSQARARYPSARSQYVMEACRETTGFRDAVVVPLRDTDGAVLTTTFLSPHDDLDPAALYSFWVPGQIYASRGREIVTGFALESDCPPDYARNRVPHAGLEGQGRFRDRRHPRRVAANRAQPCRSGQAQAPPRQASPRRPRSVAPRLDHLVSSDY